MKIFEDELTEDEIAALDLYRDAVDEIIQSDTGTEISNGSPLHARFILSRIFENASAEVSIYSGHLRRVARDELDKKWRYIWVHEPLIQAAMGFLRKPNTSLSILVQNSIDGDPGCAGTDHSFLKRIVEDKDRKGKITLVVARSGENGLLKSTPRHFAIADTRIYRFETRGDAFWATASFNGPTLSRILKAHFTSLWNRVLASENSRNEAIAAGKFEFLTPGPFEIPPGFVKIPA